MELEKLLDQLDGVRKMPGGYAARCPAHDDHVASLSVNEAKNGGVVMFCHAGCHIDAVLDRLGLSMGDLAGKPHVVASYEYRRPDGSIAYTVDRWANPKTFRVRGHLPAPAERVLYQAPAIAWARSTGAVVNVVEGEKDADRLVIEGHVATTNVSGAGSWLPHYGPQLAGCHVVIWADNDAPGRLHARAVAESVRPHAASVAMVVPRHGKDVSDLLDAGYTLADADPLPETDDLAAYVASGVRTRRVNWAWAGVIPFGKLVMIEGDPGDGKSILTVDLAARWTTGASMPDGSPGGAPFPVCMVSAEDDMEDTIVPRLTAAGADLGKVWLYPHGSSAELPFEFASDLPALERKIVEVGAKAVVFDPLPAFLASGVDTNNDMSVRKALYPLRALAARTGAAVIVVRHLNKGGSGSKAVYRGNGSIAFTGAARCAYLVAADPDDPAGRLFACVKTNISRKPPTLRYTIEVGHDEVPYLAWHGVADLSAQDALDGARHESTESEAENGRRKVREYAIAFLRDLLANGPRTWPEIVAAGREDGYTEHPLRLARAEAGLIKVIGSAGTRSITWALPEATEPEGVSDPAAPDVPTCHLPDDRGAIAYSPKMAGKWQVGKRDGVEDLADVCANCGAREHLITVRGDVDVTLCIDCGPYDEEAA